MMKKNWRRLVSVGLCAAMMMTVAGCSVKGGSGSSSSGSSSDSTDAAEATETNYPERDITMIIPTETGGGSDVIARYFATALTEELGVTVVPQNVGGAATAVGMQQLVNSAADGYTIVMSLSSLSTMAYNGYADITYEDMAQICAVNFDPNVIFIRPDDDRFSTIEEFIAYAKEHPGELNCGTGSAGGVAHLAIVDFCEKAGIELNIVPDTSGGGFDLKLVNGDVDCVVCGPIDIASAVAAGTVKMIVTMSEERLADFPDVPTATEIGVESVTDMVRGYHAPKGTPDEVIDVLEAAFKKIIESDDYVEFLANQYSNALFLDSEEWSAKCAEELEYFPQIMETAGITVS